MDIRPFHHAKKISRKPAVLVAGGAGFIGSYLCELLLLKNCRVIAVDNLLTGKKENLKNCFDHPNFTFIKHDLTTPLENIDEVDYIFHLAGLEAYVDRTELSLELLKVNAYGTANLLKLAKKTGAKFLLGSTFKVYEATISTKSLAEYFGKEKIDVSLGSLAESKRFAEALTTQYHQRGEVNARIVRLGFIYGPRMNLQVGGELALLIREAVSGGPLRVLGDGLRKVHPTFVSDIVYGLSKAIFSSGTGGKIFSLINPEGVTLLALAHELKEASQKPLAIEFVPEKEKEERLFSFDEVRRGQTDLGWKAKVGIREGVRQTLKYFGKAMEVKPALPSRPTTRLPRTERFWGFPRLTYKARIIIATSFLFLSALFYPFVSLAFNSFWGARNLAEAQQALLEVDLPRASKKARVAQQAFRRANQKVQRFSFFFDFFGLEKSGARIEKLFSVGEKVGESIVHAGLAGQSATELGKIIFQDQPGDIEKLLSEIKVELDFAYDQLSFAEADLKKEEDLLPVKVPFSEIRSLLLKTREGIGVVPEVIGLEGRRVYLVLLQNNMELRPTGGFIGSYALATFTEGRLIDFEVEDVYTADGQLKGHVEPPAELKKYLGEAGWYLRDSNWSPDFPTSALRAEWFLEKETGRTVDGVIGVDLFLAQNVLKQIGEVEVPDFEERINHQNLFERAEYHSEAGFFPGSTQKKDFLAGLTRALFEKIKRSEEKTWLSLGKAVYDSLKEKDFLVYLHDPEAMRVISNLGWDGRIGGVECEEGGRQCLVDYLMIVEANVGVNKANYFVARNLVHQVKIEPEGTVKETLQIQYQNQSQTETFPAGRYKNYLRVLVPRGAKLEGVAIDGKKLDEEKIDREEMVDKESFGFLVEVPIQEQRGVEIAYELEEKVDFEKTTQYFLLLQKQPGIRDEVFNFWLTAPEGVSLIEAKPNAARTLNALVFNPEFNQDIVFEVGVVR